MKRTSVTICGTGNSAHVLAGLAAARNELDVRVFTRDRAKAARWNTQQIRGPLRIGEGSNGSTRVVSCATPRFVTSDPEVGVEGSDMIVLAVPATAHEAYLAELAPFIKAGTVIVGLPGNGSFEFEVRRIISTTPVVVLNFDSLPWSCVVEEFGCRARILGSKQRIVGAMCGDPSRSRVERPFETIRAIVGPDTEVTECGSSLAITLMAINAFTHPPLMFAKWRYWDGKPLAEEPLIYHSVEAAGAELLTLISQESVSISRKVMQSHPHEDLSEVVPMLEWDRTRYGHLIEDESDQLTALRTNRAYATLRYPMKPHGGGFVPDYKHRFLSEDVPFGLVPVRGVAALAGVDTPAIDRVLRWSQEQLGREYLVGDELIGEDLSSTRAPQRYGTQSLAELL